MYKNYNNAMVITIHQRHRSRLTQGPTLRPDLFNIEILLQILLQHLALLSLFKYLAALFFIALRRSVKIYLEREPQDWYIVLN